MGTTRRDHSLPLPKGWSRRVRSAVVQAVSMANVIFTATRGQAENQFNARVRLQADNHRLRREISLLHEELRIKDARMERLPAQRRPHYPPVERLAILELRAARAWSLAQTARRLLVTPLAVASWTKRLDDQGPNALVQTREPVNRFPEFVRSCHHLSGRYREAPESRLARRSHDGPHGGRLLGSLAPVLPAAVLAVLLVGRRRRRPLLPARDGHRDLPQGTLRRGDQAVPGAVQRPTCTGRPGTCFWPRGLRGMSRR